MMKPLSELIRIEATQTEKIKERRRQKNQAANPFSLAGISEQMNRDLHRGIFLKVLLSGC